MKCYKCGMDMETVEWRLLCNPLSCERPYRAQYHCLGCGERTRTVSGKTKAEAMRELKKMGEGKNWNE